MSKRSSSASSQPRNPSDALVAKVWGFCNTLRDDGVGASEHLEQLTFLLFLKMSDLAEFVACYNPRIARVMYLCKMIETWGRGIGVIDLLILLRLRNRTDLYSRFLLPAMNQGLIEYTIPDKPNSRLQKYRLTPKGKATLKAASSAN